MVSSTAVRGLVALVLGLGFASQAALAQTANGCQQTVTARAGDTCASLAQLAGISMTQFLQSNPYVTSCSVLVAGQNYCTAGTAAGPLAPAPNAGSTGPAPAASAPAASAQPTGPLRVSVDGTCGSGITCTGSRFGVCCSAHGFCGSTADYCGAGCQVGLGACNPGVSVSAVPSQQPATTLVTAPPAPVSTVTTTITATIFVTNIVPLTTGTVTSSVVVTATSIIQASVINTVITSSIVLQTSTVVATQTQTSHVTLTATNTVTLTATSTSVAVVTSTSTVVRTRTTTVESTSVEIDTLTTIVTSTSVYIITSTATRVVTSTDAGCSPSFVIGPSPSFIIGPSPSLVIGPQPIITPTRPGAGGGIIPTLTQVQPAPARPSPVLPGAPINCKSFDQIRASDNCRRLATRNNLTLLEFYKLNPSVSTSVLSSLLCTPDLLQLLLSGLCQIDCDNLWEGYYVCVRD